MKKALLSLILCAGVLGAAMAQGDGITTKRDKGKGYNVLPEAGDWGLGFNPDPFLKPALNLFNNTANNAPFTADFFLNDMKIGFYMVQDDETILRGGLRIGFTSHTDKIANGTNPNNTVSQSAFSIGLTGGIEKVKSLRHRLMGYYGAQVNIDLLPKSDTLTVAGKKYNTRGSVTYTDATTSANGYKISGGSTFNFGVGAFVGVRYFFAPKISLGGEFGWGLGISSVGKRTFTPNTGTAVVRDAGSFEFKADTSVTGRLTLAFWF